MNVNAAKAFGTLAGMALTVVLTGCAVSPIGCPVAGHRVDEVFDTIETPAIATIADDEPGSCQSGEPATAMRRYQPDNGPERANSWPR